jgi:hypothetical protein
MGKQGLIRMLKQARLPVTFGSPHPHMGVAVQDGVFRLRKLVINQEKARADSEAARAARRSWQPEHYYALGEPIGEVTLEAPTLNELIAKIEAYEPWPANW